MEFNFEKDIKCMCGIIFDVNDFKDHYKNCDSFKATFGDFDKELSNLIKENSNPKNKLLIIKFIIEEYIEILNKKIKGNFVEISRALRKEFLNSMKNSSKFEELNKIIN